MAQKEKVSSSRIGAGLEAQTHSAGVLPRIPLDLWQKRVSIAINWSLLFFFNCIIPVLLYWVLKHVAHLRLTIVVAIPTAIFGVVSLAAWFRRLFSLLKKNSTTRPLGRSRSSLDYFQWNFTIGFIYITICIVIAETRSPDANPRIASIPLSLLMIQVCLQILVVAFLVAAKVRYPVAISSGKKGELMRAAIVTITEDVVAVDGAQGQEFRNAFIARHDASPHIRRLLQHLSWIWGISGLAIAAMVIALVFTLDNEDISWTIGWTVPWVWAGLCTIITIVWTRSTLRRERAEYQIEAPE